MVLASVIEPTDRVILSAYSDGDEVVWLEAESYEARDSFLYVHSIAENTTVRFGMQPFGIFFYPTAGFVYSIVWKEYDGRTTAFIVKVHTDPSTLWGEGDAKLTLRGPRSG